MMSLSFSVKPNLRVSREVPSIPCRHYGICRGSLLLISLLELALLYPPFLWPLRHHRRICAVVSQIEVFFHIDVLVLEACLLQLVSDLLGEVLKLRCQLPFSFGFVEDL